MTDTEKLLDEMIGTAKKLNTLGRHQEDLDAVLEILKDLHERVKKLESRAAPKGTSGMSYNPVAIFCEEMKQVHNASPAIEPAEAKMLITTARSIGGADRWRAVCRAYARDPDPWVSGQGWPPHLLRTRKNRYLAEIGRPQPKKGAQGGTMEDLLSIGEDNG
jgi:hypothetical protein